MDVYEYRCYSFVPKVPANKLVELNGHLEEQHNIFSLECVSVMPHRFPSDGYFVTLRKRIA